MNMLKILETRQLEFDKSSFLIDLVEHESGALYIEIVQRIHNDKAEGQKIKINPTILMDVIKVLLDFHEKVPNRQLEGVIHFTESDKKKIQDRYLKGISMNDLALQFDTTDKIIEMILRNMGLVIISDHVPEKKRHFGKGKK